MNEDQIEEDRKQISEGRTDKKQNGDLQQRKFSQVLTKVTMIAVGLILVVILVSAGFIACHKTKEQDAYISHLLNKISTYEKNEQGGTGTGLTGSSLETTPIISADQSNSNNSRDSLPSGKFP